MSLSKVSSLHNNNHLHTDNYCVNSIIIVPPPTVRVVHQPDKVQFFTTDSVDLICLSDINLAVDTPITVDMTWSGSSGNRMQSDGRISVLGDRGTFTEHDSTLQFSSLRSSDTGTYTCTSVASSTSRYVVASNTTSAASSINASMWRHSLCMLYTCINL